MRLEENRGTIIFLPTVLSIFHSLNGVLILVLIFICAVDIFLFSSYQIERGSSLLMGIHSVGMIDLKFT